MHMVLVCDAMKMGNCANCIPIDINGKTQNNPLTLVVLVLGSRPKYFQKNN